MHESPLPSEFSELSGRVHYIQRKSAYEYSSSCPKCGGGIHSNGDFSDRFIMLLKSKINKPFGFCRKCGYKWWEGQKDGREIDPATIALLQKQAKEAEERHKEERRIKLAQFSTTELWNELHDRLGEEQREWWRRNGISDDWQNYLKLGYTPDKAYNSRTGLEHTPAYTIPYFGYGFIFKTMQYRLCNPSEPADRYRFEAGLDTSYYMTTPNRHITDEVVVCEGAKKGIVVRIRGESSYNTTVLAVPSKVDWRSCGILDEIKNCGRVYIMFDPDCYEQPPDSNANWTPQPIQFAKEIGDSARIMECSVKIDDAFIHYGLDQTEWNALKKQAVKL